jgi:hypothetical protein
VVVWFACGKGHDFAGRTQKLEALFLFAMNLGSVANAPLAALR